MNWPDAGFGKEGETLGRQPWEGNPGKESRIRQQNTGGESNPAHFSVIRISGDVLGCHSQHGFALPRSSEMPVKAASCPLSVQSGRKLMQKIHSLTDN
ncbi:MAG: hypothetical protein ACREEK_05045 [Bradyrhizobium sp.]